VSSIPESGHGLAGSADVQSDGLNDVSRTAGRLPQNPDHLEPSQAGTCCVEHLGGRIEVVEVRGGVSSFRVELPEPSGTVPVRISGGASGIIVRRPAGVVTRVRLKGWASHLIFDDQSFGGVGSDARLVR
jgi:hypothetical protein